MRDGASRRKVDQAGSGSWTTTRITRAKWRRSCARRAAFRRGSYGRYFRRCARIVRLRWARDQAVPVRVIGAGSNLLVAQGGVDGLVIKVATTRSDVEGLMVRAEAGVTLANLARRLAKQGYGGLEWAANVPGTVGGA